jgi:hypothetical protein
MMQPTEATKVESSSLSEFARIMQGGEASARSSGGPAPRLNLDQNNLKNSLGQLVLTLVKLLHELLERQGIRRIEGGTLTDEQIERLGLTLMKQAQEIDRLRREFGLEEEDLNLDLGPLGQLL